MTAFARPTPAEYAPFYAGYVAAVPDGDVLELLERQTAETIALLRPLDSSTWRSRYAEGKWSIAEILGHLCDGERVFAYRALRFARGDRTELPGFEQDDYIPTGRFDDRAPGDLLAEYEAVRAATLALFRGLPPEATTRMGIANGAETSVRAILYMIAGHERHHLDVIRRRYL